MVDRQVSIVSILALFWLVVSTTQVQKELYMYIYSSFSYNPKIYGKETGFQKWLLRKKVPQLWLIQVLQLCLVLQAFLFVCLSLYSSFVLLCRLVWFFRHVQFLSCLILLVHFFRLTLACLTVHANQTCLALRSFCLTFVACLNCFNC